MEDLGNERRAVVRQLESMGVEPVHAETMSPDGGSSWETIRYQIEQCHLFVLLLGDRYGWEPNSGHGANSGLSVTHLELNEARSRNKLVLAFMKILPYGAAADVKRDNFRREVSDWAGGVFRQEFEWADDLADKVGAAITNLWTDALMKSLVSSSDSNDQAPSVKISPATAVHGHRSSKVLLAGAGMSIAAGYPSALLLKNMLAQDLWDRGLDNNQLLAFSFSDLATYYEGRFGRDRLSSRINDALNTPQSVTPTLAHIRAVTVFKNIVTTNYDDLFERACDEMGLKYRVLHPFDSSTAEHFDGLSLYKIAGSATSPKTLALTDHDQLRAAADPVFSEVRDMLVNSELVIIGHSLRDDNVRRLLANRDPSRGALYVSPTSAATDEMMLHRFGLALVESTADAFMADFGDSEAS